VGRLSYGIYLWHYPIFNVLGQKYTGWTGFRLVGTQLAATFAAAAASYYLVERPALRLKGRFGRRPRTIPASDNAGRSA
jgi:peptidoglycan/LPS O-acetylase OafA/YrhL